MKNLRQIFSNTIFQLIVIIVIVGAISFTAVSIMNSKKPILASKNCQGLCVNITKDGIDPDTLTVKVGEFVQFNSADGKQHNLGLGGGVDGDKTAHDADHEHVGEFTSGDFNADEAWRVQFKTAGTYKFHDHYNPKLNILVVVYAPGGPAKL